MTVSNTIAGRFRNLLTGLGLASFLPAFIAIIALTFALALADFDKRVQYLQAERAAVAQQLSDVAAKLENKINGNVKLVEGLAAVVATEPDITQERFSELSERIFASKSQLRNIAGAPDLVVRLVYPDSNRASLGLDYRKNEKQRDAALKTMETGKVILTGPVDLVQGGTGLIARYPIFVKDGAGQRFWGIVSAVIDLQKLYRDSGLLVETNGLNISIALERSGKQDVFFGGQHVRAGAPVTMALNLGYDTWHFAATPKLGWNASPSDILAFRIYALIVALCILVPLIWAGFLMSARQRIFQALSDREDQLERLSQRLELALDASNIGVWEFEPSSGILIWDHRMRELYGVPDDQEYCSYQDWEKALHPDDLEAASDVFSQALTTGSIYLDEFRVVSPTGEVRHIRAHGATHRQSNGKTKIVGANWNVTKDVHLQLELRSARARAERQNRELEATRRTLEYQSLHDALTGLPNRRFLDQFISTQNGAKRTERIAFVHIDLDRFKEVNDTLGHAAGDQVLRVATSRLKNLLGPGDVAARIGGDEFVVALCGTRARQRATRFASKIVQSFGQQIDAGGHPIRVGASVGVACQEDPRDELGQLLVNADIALYEAKKQGRNRVIFFSDDLRLVLLTSKRRSDEVLQAIESDQFVPYFQPQFDARTHAVVGVEALARWNHPTRGLLTPDQFLSIAESLNRVSDIDESILNQALFQAKRWEANGLSIPKVSVNISAQRLGDPRLLAKLATLPLRKGALSFELLESISFEGNEESLALTIRDIKALGIDIEIDDFGTGHASIVSLIELAPTRLKIDRKLITPITTSTSQRRLVASIIEFGRSQDIEIVAEGVETLAHAEILRELGCHTLQGYAFGKPMSSADLMSYVKERQATNSHAAHA